MLLNNLNIFNFVKQFKFYFQYKQADEDKERRRQEIRDRIQAEIDTSAKSQQKKKGGFMTPERKKRLRVRKMLQSFLGKSFIKFSCSCFLFPPPTPLLPFLPSPYLRFCCVVKLQMK